MRQKNQFMADFCYDQRSLAYPRFQSGIGVIENVETKNEENKADLPELDLKLTNPKVARGVSSPTTP